MIAAQHDAVGADHGNDVGHDLRTVADRVVMETAQIGHGRFGHVFGLGTHARAVGHAPDQRRERAACMRQHDLELRKRVHHAAEHQRRGGDAGIVRIAEEIAQVVAAHALGAHRVDRMQQDRQAQRFAARVNRPERFVVEVLAHHMRRQVDPAHAGQIGRAIKFLQRQRRRLHGQRQQAVETLRIADMRDREAVVVDLREPEPERRRRPVHHR